MNFEQIKNIVGFSKPASGRDKIILIVKIAVAAALLWYLIHYAGLNNIINLFRFAKLLYLIPALLLMLVNVSLQYAKWKKVCAVSLAEYDRKKIFHSLMYGIFGGAITPVRAGEYVARKFPFDNIRFFEISIATFIDKAIGLSMIYLWGVVAMLLYLHFIVKTSSIVTITVFLWIVIWSFALLYLFTHPDFWNKVRSMKFFQRPRVAHYVERLGPVIQLERRVLYSLLAINFVFYLCIDLQYAFLLLAFSKPIAFTTAMWCGALAFAAKAVIPPISFGEIGIREITSMFFVVQFGIEPASGFNAAVMLFFINIILPALFGAGLFLSRKNAR